MCVCVCVLVFVSEKECPSLSPLCADCRAKPGENEFITSLTKVGQPEKNLLDKATTRQGAVKPLRARKKCPPPPSPPHLLSSPPILPSLHQKSFFPNPGAAWGGGVVFCQQKLTNLCRVFFWGGEGGTGRWQKSNLYMYVCMCVPVSRNELVTRIYIPPPLKRLDEMGIQHEKVLFEFFFSIVDKKNTSDFMLKFNMF